MRELLDRFVTAAKQSQILIVQPSLVAMIYAANAKPSCFTGFTRVRTLKRPFDYIDFLTAQVLPGPASFITCIFEPHGKMGSASFTALEKQTALSQIPGLRYRLYMLANLPRPQACNDAVLSLAVR